MATNRHYELMPATMSKSKRRPGRPKLPPQNRKTWSSMVNLTPAEKEAFEKYVRANLSDESNVLRSLLVPMLKAAGFLKDPPAET